MVVMNRFQGYEDSIPNTLQGMGYEAVWSDARPGNSFIAKLLIRLGILQKIESRSKANIDRIVEDAKKIEAETILCISPENLRAREIKWLRTALPGVKIILYLYDSSANRYLDQQMIDHVDVAYSFDIDDCNKFKNLGFIPLFHHHDKFEPPTRGRTEFDYDFCFIGTGRLRRLLVLSGIAKKAKESGDTFLFYLFAPSVAQYFFLKVVALVLGYDGVLSRKSMPFEQYLDNLAKSACVIDIEQQNQGGLTIRTMDAVFAGRPFATSNGNILLHDFYPHFPISVFSTENLNVEVPALGDSIEGARYFEKYHISNWLETILTGKIEDYRLDNAVLGAANEGQQEIVPSNRQSADGHS